MNHQLTEKLIWIGYYVALASWIILTVLLLLGLIKKDWYHFKRILKYLINSVAFLIAWMFILQFALIVRAPISTTRQASITAVKNWIRENQQTDIYVGIVSLLILFVINLFFYFKIERKRNTKDLIVLAISGFIVLTVAIWLSGQDAYFGLLEEIDRQFG